ncbi:MAG: hydantoinase B/oxoprolinase family protein [Alphaproteobacteria bacterium]|nr:hydantoinase B/oxoprolinase family protein [Alphaproteobacteria bacterium]
MDSDNRPTYDAVTLEVLWTRLISAVDEAAAALVRSSFSTVVRESFDFSCVITDARGQSLAQATDSIPSFIGTLPATVKHFLAEFPPETLQPGDVLCTNDPWLGTGHLPDITVAKPLFHGGRLVGFSASTAHAPDIGGKIRSAEPREVFEEGLQIPPLKIMRAGEPDETFFKFLRKNVRTPDLTVGDLWAQLAALDLMQDRVQTLLDEYRMGDLGGLADEIHGRCERAMRAAILALPDGVYHSELQTDGLATPVTVKMALTVTGDEILIDFEGSSAQVDRAINVAYCYTYAYTSYGVKCLLSPDLPNNEGALRPITIKAPTGSIVNSTFPAAGGARVMVGHYLPILVFAALGDVAGERIMAGAGSPIWAITQAGVRDGRTYANVFFFNGGMGGNPLRDGVSCLSWPSNISSTPVEVIEQLAPFRVHYKRFRPGTGGAGRHRGGLGQEILFECLSETPIAISFLAERTKIPAPGIKGGGPGTIGEVRIDDHPVDPKAQHIIGPGNRVLMRTPGGGGYGDPAAREPALIAADKRMGYV